MLCLQRAPAAEKPPLGSIDSSAEAISSISRLLDIQRHPQASIRSCAFHYGWLTRPSGDHVPCCLPSPSLFRDPCAPLDWQSDHQAKGFFFMSGGVPESRTVVDIEIFCFKGWSSVIFLLCLAGVCHVCILGSVCVLTLPVVLIASH